MAFFKFFKAKDSGSAPKGGAAAGVQAHVQDMRVRARYRLVGAVVLVVLAVIVFPLLFDTEQRPAVINAPVVIADAGNTEAAGDASATAAPEVDAQPLAPDAPGDVAPADAATEAPTTGAAGMEDADDADDNEEWVLGPEIEPLAGTDTPDAEQEPSATRSKIRVAPAAGSAAAEGQVARAPAESRTDPGSDAAEARRALAALQGRGATQPAAPAAPSGRKGAFVVQVGAFAQEAQVRSVQQRIANAGLKSHTQVVQTDAGPRTRVRVGPYDSREAAERARAALERGGLPGQVLTP